MALLTINQACAHLNVSRSTLYRMMRAGALRFTLIEGRRRIPEEELYRIIAEGMEQAGVKA